MTPTESFGFRLLGYSSSAVALGLIGLYFRNTQGTPIITLWVIGFLGIFLTVAGAIIGEIALDNIRNSNAKNRNK